MEEPQSWPVERDERSQKTEGDDRSAKTAETLRTLRAKADESLASHRRRVSDIEAELNLRLQQIAEELARDRVAEEMEATAAAELQANLEDMQASLTGSNEELEALRHELASQADEHETQLGQRDEEIGQLIEQSEQVEAERNQLLQQLQELRDESDRLSTDLKSAQQALEDLRNQQCTDCISLREELAELQRQSAERQAELDELREQLSASRQTEEELRAQECADCANVQNDLAHLQMTHKENQQQLQASQQRVEEMEISQSETQQALQESQAKIDEAEAMLRTAEQRILELDNTKEHEEQLDQLNRKFELALADVHKLKRENAELHAELASRPAASDGESPELVSLRSERDALATRVSELENAPKQTVDDDIQQELADLQRRFELAVDDVRELKQENAKLEERLQANATDASEPTVDASDWQSQKARLLAELDAEDQGTLAPERREARATIEGTISITDQVVAEKDKEIAELRDALETRPAEEQLQEMKRAIQEEVLDNDEIIQTERKRLEEIQQEWQEKLRKAELELSVERAKLAREHSALEEKLATLQEASQDAVQDENGKPRRRWMSALGLKDDEEQKQ